MNVNKLFSRRWAQWKEQLQKQTKSKFFREGLPFILFVVIGSFGLKEICSIRYEFKTTVETVQVPISEEEYQERNKHEKELVESYKKIDYEKWRNKRIWRESDEGKKFS
ncbi:hypothetical protein LOTGIDRAFT_233255 [Lottia gigantea]|uniref:Cytochrome c oxidase assembly protein COX16 homolog, mitochondrial n=1 Tax=Lottia gigantea TaxID=225164 RepID=V4BSK4_LOTGI|nr:hypothetical protein LOTGIDRAFT_233255 [Lottia gigantea]ESO91944.1 hypothetical protein LOTGIDRAFT_233255 [Lottia gigantea]